MQLGNGLVLRWSTQADTERIAWAVSQGFAGPDGSPTAHMAETVRRLMRGDCPAMTPEDFCIVEDTTQRGHPVVACLCLQRFEWTYEDIPLRVARPEVVTSLPAYRHHGLVRALFSELHRKSEAEGCDLQAIVGIPYFYHKMGYAYGLDLEGKRVASLASSASSASLARSASPVEPYILRDATMKDIPFLRRCYHRRHHESLLWATISDQQWRYYIDAWKVDSERAVRCVKIITDPLGGAKGILLTHPVRWWKTLDVYALELAEGVNYARTMPAVLSTLKIYGETMPTERPDTVPLEDVEFVLGRSHPAYDALGTLAPIWKPPLAWYIRIPNMSRLLERIAPVLEARLNGSECAGSTGELKVNLYTGGVRLVFKQGHVTLVEPWHKDPYAYDADVSMAPSQFWQLLLGYRSLEQLRAEADSPDVLVDDKEAVLLNALFPARSSFVFRIEFK